VSLKSGSVHNLGVVEITLDHDSARIGGGDGVFWRCRMCEFGGVGINRWIGGRVRLIVGRGLYRAKFGVSVQNE